MMTSEWELWVLLEITCNCLSTICSSAHVSVRNEPPHDKTNEMACAPSDKTNEMACAPSEDSDQPGHLPSLIRVFAVSSVVS